jgi:hypothetical protein
LDLDTNVIRVFGWFSIIGKANRDGLVDKDCHFMRIEGGNVRTGLGFITSTRVYKVNGADGEDLTRAEIEARDQIAKLAAAVVARVPGFESAYLIQVAPNIGVRETRHILGDYLLTGEDIAGGVRFSDSIGKGSQNHTLGLPMHSPDAGEGSEQDTKLRDMLEPVTWFDIPYRTLLPKGIDGVLLAGRCMSATHEADCWTRPMHNCMVMGQAAGTAAALAIKQGVAVRSLDYRLLHDSLANQGVPLPNIGV